jgi:hypothetical protein
VVAALQLRLFGRLAHVMTLWAPPNVVMAFSKGSQRINMLV